MPVPVPGENVTRGEALLGRVVLFGREGNPKERGIRTRVKTRGGAAEVAAAEVGAAEGAELKGSLEGSSSSRELFSPSALAAAAAEAAASPLAEGRRGGTVVAVD